MTMDRLWACPRCGTRNPARERACRDCGLAHPGSRVLPGSAGAAAALSGLLPGLGQLYQERWRRGALMLVLPLAGIGLAAALLLSFDMLLDRAVRHASLATLVVLGGLFAFHIVAVADAFAASWRQARVPGRILDLLLLACVVIALTGIYGVVYRGSVAWASVLTRVFEPLGAALSVAPGATPAPQWSGQERLSVLLLGLDTRGEFTESQNTDTMIVLTLDPLNRAAAMLSIPRDTLVQIPGHRRDKINAAYAYGGRSGPDLARRTVEQFLGVTIHSYALIDFPAFTKIIDAFGGVQIDVRRPLRDEEYPTADYGIERVHLLPGPQILGGLDALRYARSRHDSDDFGRARRQQDVVGGLRQRVAHGGLARIPGIVDQVGPAVQTSFEPSGILPLTRTGAMLDAGAIRSEVLVPCGMPGATRCQLREENSPRGYYLIPDRARVADLVASVFYDPRVRREAARIEVRSSGARANAARGVADRLEERSFTVSRVTDGPPGRSAVVLRDPAKRHTAEVLAQQLGLTVVTDTAESADADIVLRVGTDLAFATDRLR